MRIHRIGMLYSLLSILNENEQDDSFSVLAEYFLRHYDELDKLNIFDTASDCYVSRSGVRRFCQTLGFENFKDFKEVRAEVGTDDDKRSFFSRYSDRENYRDILTAEINTMIDELDNRMNTAEVENIVTRIHDAEKVVFLVSSTSGYAVKMFQHGLVFCGKVTRVLSGSSAGGAQLLSELCENDYLMTVSASGIYAEAADSLVKNCKAYKTLVTLNRDPLLKQNYDKVYHLSASDLSHNSRVYRIYGMNYMFDILSSAYFRKYGDGK